MHTGGTLLDLFEVVVVMIVVAATVVVAAVVASLLRGHRPPLGVDAVAARRGAVGAQNRAGLRPLARGRYVEEHSHALAGTRAHRQRFFALETPQKRPVRTHERLEVGILRARQPRV